MKKGRKRIIFMIVALFILTSSTSAYAVPMFGYTFTYEGKSCSSSEGWFHILDNPSPGYLSATKEVQRTRFASCTTTVEVSVIGLTNKVTGGLEIELGGSAMERWTATFEATPWTKVRCSSGSYTETPYGTQRYYAMWICMSAKTVSLSASTGQYTKQQLLLNYPH